MKRGKKFRFVKILKDEDYGFTQGNQTHVNLTRIWDETQNKQRFVKEFSDTYVHEFLHVLLAPVRGKRLIGEEKVIRKMLNEPWTPSIAKHYT